MKRYILMLTVLGLTASGCHTFVRIKPDYAELPTESLRTVALEIEQAVRDGNRTPEIADRDGIVINSDIAIQALRTRAARSELVDQFRDSGFACERPNGLIDILNSKEYKNSRGRHAKDRDALLVYSENQDRWRLYESIRKDSNFPPRSLSAIQQIFYETRLQCMKNGQKYEDAAGEVVAVSGASESK
ncbi:MAG: YdbL family protein [bacterium]|nr:YdbL family protein [bacterium]